MAKQIITEELRLALNNQISHEKYNANLYLYIAGFLKNKGMDKLAIKFEEQHKEETEHSILIYSFLTDMNAMVELLPVEGVNINIDSIIDLANLYLDREIATTKSLEQIRQITIDNEEGIAEEFLRHMIGLQRHEIGESTTFLDNAELCGEDWYKVKVWNDSL